MTDTESASSASDADDDGEDALRTINPRTEFNTKNANFILSSRNMLLVLANIGFLIFF